MALLGQLPLHNDIRQHMDDGCPAVFGAPDGELSQTYLKLARRVGAELYFSAKPINMTRSTRWRWTNNRRSAKGTDLGWAWPPFSYNGSV